MLNTLSGSWLFILLITTYHQSSAHAELSSAHEAATPKPTRQARPQRTRAVMRLIEVAIARGVPQYNKGDPEACRDIYAVALSAVALLAPSLSSLTSARDIESTLRAARAMSPDQGAWRLRRSLDALYAQLSRVSEERSSHASSTSYTSSPSSTNSTSQGSTQMLKLTFTSDLSWYALNDRVMGGVSRGGMSVETTPEGAQIGVFSGQLSRENNGGFSSARVNIEAGSLTGADGLELRVRGDGREYFVLVALGSTSGSWQAKFTAPAAWSTLKIPFAEMHLSIRGWAPPGAPPVDPRAIEKIGLLIKDKREDLFRLEISEISAYQD